jgi:AcrR family transcriptional regulator
MGRAHSGRRRRTQAERLALSRSALLGSAARALSRYGYGNLVLDQVAREAGYTRGSLYHQFRDKDLALAVIQWVAENWMREVGEIRSLSCSRWRAVTRSSAAATSPGS